MQCKWYLKSKILYWKLEKGTYQGKGSRRGISTFGAQYLRMTFHWRLVLDYRKHVFSLDFHTHTWHCRHSKEPTSPSFHRLWWIKERKCDWLNSNTLCIWNTSAKFVNQQNKAIFNMHKQRKDQRVIHYIIHWLHYWDIIIHQIAMPDRYMKFVLTTCFFSRLSITS